MSVSYTHLDVYKRQIVQFLHLQRPQLGRERPVQGGHGGGVADKSRLGGDVLPSQGIEGSINNIICI